MKTEILKVVIYTVLSILRANASEMFTAVHAYCNETLIYHTGLAQSPVQCIAMCNLDSNCEASSFDADGNACSFHKMTVTPCDGKVEKTLLLYATKKVLSCWPPWKIFKDSCYLKSSVGMDWNSAKENCERYGAKSVEVETAEEDDFLRQFVPLTNYGGDYFSRYWTGGTKISNGSWIWSNSSKAISYNGWKSDLPSNNNGNENCLEYLDDMRSGRWIWNDLPCFQRISGYLCEKSIS